MVHVSIINYSFHAYRIVVYISRPETRSKIVKENRNIFCSLGYFETWSLRRSLCRQTSQPASLYRLSYSLAGEMVFNVTKAGYEFIE